MKVAVVGLGKMGEALVKGFSGLKDLSIVATVRNEEKATELSASLGIKVVTDNRAACKNAEIIILAVKPYQVENVLSELRGQIAQNQVLVSIAASITTTQLIEFSGSKGPIIRAMPNTPAIIREGMTVFSPAPGVSDVTLKKVQALFETVGKTAVVDESLLDGVTGLSGCGPAYVFLMIEALSEAGVKVGLRREVATLLAAQTLLGASKMVLERGVHPAALKDEVTTPAGCTIDGLMALEEGKLRVTLIKAVLAATKRSEKLRIKT